MAVGGSALTQKDSILNTENTERRKRAQEAGMSREQQWTSDDVAGVAGDRADSNGPKGVLK